MAEAKRIVIVGGGVAGLELATRLGRRGRDQVTLVDQSLSHVWKPTLHTFAAGTARPGRQKISFLAQAKASGFHFRAGALTGVDRTGKSLSIKPYWEEPWHETKLAEMRLAYDRLVIAIGSQADDFGTPGVAEHCQTIDDLTEAESFHAALRERLFRSLQDGSEISVAIVGGGATGVELAAEIRRAVGLFSRYTPDDPGQRLRLSLIESGPRLLSAFPDPVSQVATRELKALGVDVRTGAVVSGVEPDGFRLKHAPGIEAQLRVWAAGVKAPKVLAGIDGLELSKTGQIVVTPSLQASREPSLFAMGDCAALIDPATKRDVPATAQAAHQQAQHLARHLGVKPLGEMPPFQYRDRGSIVSLADYNGWGTLGRYTFGGGRLRGLSARAAHELLYRQHQLGIYGLGRGLLEWVSDDLGRLIDPPVQLD